MLMLRALIRRLKDAVDRNRPGARERADILDHIERFERATEGRISGLERRIDERDDHEREA